MDETLEARARTRICFYENGWRVAGPEDLAGAVREVEVHLEIQGREQRGFILVMSPEGGRTFDHWFLSRDEALEAARDTFGVSLDAWSRLHEP
jgi:hypothetical protein